MLMDIADCGKVITIFGCLEYPQFLYIQVVDIGLPWKSVVQRDSKRMLIIIITSTTSSIILLVSIMSMVVINRLLKEVKILRHIQEGTRSFAIPKKHSLFEKKNESLYHHFQNIQTIEALSIFLWSAQYGDLRVVKERCEAQSLFVCGVKSCHKRFRSFKQVGTRWIWGCVQGVYSYRFLGDYLCFCAWK